MAGRKPDLRVETNVAYSCGALTLAVAALAKTPVGHDACITPGLPDMLPDLSDRPLGPSLDQATTTNSNSRAVTAGKREAQEPGATTTALETEQPTVSGRQYKGVKQEDPAQHDRDTHTDQEQEEQFGQAASKRPRLLDAAAAMQEEEAALEAHNRSLEKQLMAAIKEITAINRQNISMCRVLSLAGACSAAAAAPATEPGGTANRGFTSAAAAAQGSSGGGGGSCGGTALQEQAPAAAAVSQQGTACTVSNTVSNAQQQGGTVAARQLMAGSGWGCAGDSTPVLQQLQGIADQHSVVQPPKQFAQRRMPGTQQQRPKGVSLLVGAAQKQRPGEEQQQDILAVDALAVSSGTAAASDGLA